MERCHCCRCVIGLIERCRWCAIGLAATDDATVDPCCCYCCAIGPAANDDDNDDAIVDSPLPRAIGLIERCSRCRCTIGLAVNDDDDATVYPPLPRVGGVADAERCCCCCAIGLLLPINDEDDATIVVVEDPPPLPRVIGLMECCRVKYQQQPK
jgi:hypothetical protein